MGPFRYINIATLVGRFRIIDAGIRRWPWADSGMSTLLGGPIQDCRHCYSVAAVGKFRYIDIAALVGPFRIIDAGIRRWLWADSGVSTLLGGPIQDYRHCYSVEAAGQFRYIDSANLVGPFRITDIIILANLLANLARRIWVSGV